MSQVSKIQLVEKDWKKVWRLFIQTIGQVKRTQSESLITGLLTGTEQVMLSKRFAVSVLLLHGNSPSLIQRRLKMSRSTVYSIKALLHEKSQYRVLLKDFFPQKITLEEQSAGDIDTNTWFDQLFLGRTQRSRLYGTHAPRRR